MPNRRTEFIARGLLEGPAGFLVCRSVRRGYYYLPGGHVEHAEAAATALAREFTEETGLRVRVGALACVSENVFTRKGSPIHELNLVFHVEHPRPPATVRSLEGRKIAFDWVRIGDIGGLDLRPATIKGWILAGSASIVLLSDIGGSVRGVRRPDRVAPRVRQ